MEGEGSWVGVGGAEVILKEDEDKEEEETKKEAELSSSGKKCVPLNAHVGTQPYTTTLTFIFCPFSPLNFGILQTFVKMQHPVRRCTLRNLGRTTRNIVWIWFFFFQGGGVVSTDCPPVSLPILRFNNSRSLLYFNQNAEKLQRVLRASGSLSAVRPGRVVSHGLVKHA